MGVNVKQADIITREMENEMWEKGILGHEKPDQLLHTIFYLVGVNFGLRFSEQKDLRVGVQLQVCNIIFVYIFAISVFRV